MLLLSNGYVHRIFSCHLELFDFIGAELFESLMSDTHSQYTLSFY
jgi:hypothetical protein